MCACLVGGITICSSQEPSQSPQNLEQAKAVLDHVLADRKIATEVMVKNDLLFLRYNTGKFMVPAQTKVKLDLSRLREEEGPKENGILLNISMEEVTDIHQAVQIFPDDLLEGAITEHAASQENRRTPWQTVMLHAMVNSGKECFHILLLYGQGADRELLRDLLRSVGAWHYRLK